MTDSLNHFLDQCRNDIPPREFGLIPVYDVKQDDRGYMWFGTDAGLSRFDGYEFKNYELVNEQLLSSEYQGN